MATYLEYWPLGWWSPSKPIAQVVLQSVAQEADSKIFKKCVSLVKYKKERDGVTNVLLDIMFSICANILAEFCGVVVLVPPGAAPPSAPSKAEKFGGIPPAAVGAEAGVVLVPVAGGGDVEDVEPGADGIGKPRLQKKSLNYQKNYLIKDTFKGNVLVHFNVCLKIDQVDSF